jgi:DNA-binding SARP family transcriptional activator/ABC-type oligopeptide transport system substrate-binding subunit
VEFLILGPLEVRAQGRPLAVGGPRQRALLAVLLLSANRAVPRERLLEELSGDETSGTASHTLTNQVSRLRKVLGEPRLLTRAPGYLLRVEPGELDSDRFLALLDAGRATSVPQLASERLREAEDLWRGRALADVELDGDARLELERLEELRLCAVEARIDAELALGRHELLVAELDTLTRQYPLREKLRGQQMLALYRAGRQEEALAAYRDTRARLVDEVGLEPGVQLRELEGAILRQDPALAPLHRAPRGPPPRPARIRRRTLVVAVVLAAAAAAAVLAAVPGGGRGPGVGIAPGVALLDPADGRVVSHVDSLQQPADVIFGDGRFWVLNLTPLSFVAIDPRSGRIARQIASPVEDVGSFGVARDRLWVADAAGPTVVEIDSRTGRALERLRVSGDPHDAERTTLITVAYGSLWVSRPTRGLILRIDPASGRVQHRFTGLFDAYGGAAADGAVWLSGTAGLSRIDAASNTVTATAALPQPLYVAAVGGGFAWVANEAKGEAYKVDQRGHVVATYATGDGAHSVSFSAGAAWVSNQDAGTVTRIDAVTGALRSFAAHHAVSSAAAGAGRVLVTVESRPSYAEHLAGLKGAVARLVVPTYSFDPTDPALARGPFALQAERATLAGLLNYPDAPAPAGLRLQPEIAAAMPALAPDRRTYRFTIRSGYRFSPPSGDAVTAESFRRGIEHALSPVLGGRAPGARLLADVVGARAYHAGRARHIRGVRVRGATLQLTLIRPSPDFLKRLSLPYFAPLPAGVPNLAGGASDHPPPSAGPYYAAETINGEYLLLKRNPYYRGPRPHALDAIVLREGVDAARAIERVHDGTWDGVTLADPLLTPVGAHTPALLPETRFVAFNARRGAFASARTRRAAAYALSRSALAAVWDLVPSSDLMPPGVATTRPITLAPPPHPLPAATATMAVSPDCAACRRSYEIARTAVARIGITLRRRTATVAAVRRHPDAFDLLLSSVTLEYPDSATFLSRMLTSAVPSAWQPEATRTAVRRLRRLEGTARDAAAADLAAGLAEQDAPVAALGHPAIGQRFSSRLSCRISPRFGVDLAALCLR